MKRSSLVVLLISLMGSSAFGATIATWVGPTGSWSEADKWNPAGIPAAPGATGDELKITANGTVCTVNDTRDDYLYRLSVGSGPDGATLEIALGGWIGMGETRIGAAGATSAGSIGYAKQTGGTLSLNRDIIIGRFASSRPTAQGYYTISDGTITYPATNTSYARLYVGAGNNGGYTEGTFTVVGSDPDISLRKLYVGSDGTNAGSGTIEFGVDPFGVSPIRLTDSANSSISLDAMGASSTAALLISAIVGAPPMADILLVENTASSAVSGTFDTVNGVPAPEGVSVLLTHGVGQYYYNLTYAGGVGGNDIVLRFDHYVPEPATLALLGLGGLFATIKRRRSA